MGLPAEHLATYDDVKAAPDHLVAELIEGALYTSPRPAAPHAIASSTLGMDLGTPFQRGRGGPGGWWIVDEPELHFGQDVLVPDLAGWRRERMPEAPRSAYITLPPDWVCEILSPGTVRMDRVLKLPRYARAGVGHLWLLDPIAQTLEIYALDGMGWRVVGTHGGTERLRAPPFEAVELDLLALWGGERDEDGNPLPPHVPEAEGARTPPREEAAPDAPEAPPTP